MEKENVLGFLNGDGRNLLLGQAMDLLDDVLDYKELMMGYACAIKEINTKFEVLDTEFEVRYKRNPISSIETRLKSQTSIIEKMARLGIPPTRENIEEHLNDIAGIRVICYDTNVIYEIAESLKRQDDMEFIREKDYIARPKANGYRSYHLIVAVPFYLLETKEYYPVEIQFRTMAMDMWASLEHRSCYKKSEQEKKRWQEQFREYAALLDQMERDITRA